MAKVRIDITSGNAILICACGSETDKGCPPVPGQNDDSFKCADCQHAINKAGLLKSIDTLEISASSLVVT